MIHILSYIRASIYLSNLVDEQKNVNMIPLIVLELKENVYKELKFVVCKCRFISKAIKGIMLKFFAHRNKLLE